MAKKTKKLSLGTSLITAILCLIIGAVAGVASNIYLFNETYEIPTTEAALTNIETGNFDVDVIKNQELSIHFIELGNKYTGDCTLIKVGDVEILIDAGSRTSSIEPIYNYVNQYVEGELDFVVVTHAHQDHYAGFATSENTNSLFDLFNVRTIIKFSQSNQKTDAKMFSNFNREVNQTATEKGTEVYTALQCYDSESVGNVNSTGEIGLHRTYNLSSDISLNILFHEYYENPAHSENDYSVCFMIKQNNQPKDNYYLFTGDLEEDGEESLVEYYKQDYSSEPINVSLYKAGHHGSKTSSSETLLAFFNPKVVCVCCCAGSSEYTSKIENQFPTQQFIDRIAQHTDQVFVTTLCLDYNKGSYTSFNGNIVVYTNSNKQLVVACANNNTILKDTEWFKANRICPESWK